VCEEAAEEEGRLEAGRGAEEEDVSEMVEKYERGKEGEDDEVLKELMRSHPQRLSKNRWKLLSFWVIGDVICSEEIATRENRMEEGSSIWILSKADAIWRRRSEHSKVDLCNSRQSGNTMGRCNIQADNGVLR
jgi:hypothetical protein